MSFPNMSPAPYYSVQVAGAGLPGAFQFNGVNEGLQRTLVTTAPGTLRYTYSMWVHPYIYTSGTFLSLAIVITLPTGTDFLLHNISGTGNFFGVDQDGAQTFNNFTTSLTPDIPASQWTHLLYSIDTAQATAGNRIRLYRNGNLMSDDANDNPTLNQAHLLFTNGYTHQIGMDTDAGDFSDCQLAFIDVVDGLALTPTDFAFDNGGIWTRKKYTGSYGTYGFCLDGTDMFRDVSGNGQHFTGVNMDISNIADNLMPPYTN